MNIYCLAMHEKADTGKLIESDVLGSFAQYSAVGTWAGPDGMCNTCQQHGKDYTEPLLVQWEPSTNVIGDFSWDGPWGYLFVITEPVVAFFQQHRFECNFLGVKYIEPEKESKRCVPYPYVGPKQFWGRCETFVDLDLKASGVDDPEPCPECGAKNYDFRYEGIVIPKANWHGEKMFRITTNGKSKATFVTEEARRLIEGADFTNIAFRPAGEILEL